MVVEKIELKLEDENNNDCWVEITVNQFFSISANSLNELISQSRIKLYDEKMNIISVMKLANTI